MLPMFQRELIEKKNWLTEEEVADIFSISQCMPGIIAVNTAVFVGYKQKGITGGIVAALGVVSPSLVVITLIATFLTNFTDIPAVQKAFIGLRVCVCVLICNAVLRLRKHAIVDLPSVFIFIAIFLLSLLTGLHAAILVAIAGICGVTISTLRKKSSGGGDPPDEDTPSNDMDSSSKEDGNASEGGGG